MSFRFAYSHYIKVDLKVITALHVLQFVAISVEVLVVSAVIAIGLDTAYFYYSGWRDSNREKAAKKKSALSEMLRKEQVRRGKEQSAKESEDESFFEEPFARGFDAGGLLFPREQRLRTHGNDIVDRFAQTKRLIKNKDF